jgi:UDPglucose 6-dehydrogenase
LLEAEIQPSIGLRARIHLPQEVRDTMTDDGLSVFGLGKVGVALVAALISAGHRVTGVDVNEQLVQSLNEGTFHTNEPGVMDRLSALEPGRFRATTLAAEAVAQSAVSFIIVPTPSNSLGGFSNLYVMEALEAIGRAAAKKCGRHVVAVISTVLPRSSQIQLIPALEGAAGQRIGDRLGYCYNPSFIAQGDIMKGLLQPDYVLIGEADEASGETVAAIHRQLVVNQAPIVRMTPTEAEITKLASNTHDAMRVAFANMLLALCNELPESDIDHVTGALAHRLGHRFLKGAVPFGGPCWPRDNQAMAAFMDLIGLPATLPDAINRANAEHGRYVRNEVLSATPRGVRVGVLGLAYKPETPLVEQSFGVDLAAALAAEGRQVIGWDPLANEHARSVLGNRIIITNAPEECLRCDVAVIALPLLELAALDWSQASAATVIDCWRVLDAQQRRFSRNYIPLGLRYARRSDPLEDLEHAARFAHLTN